MREQNNGISRRGFVRGAVVGTAAGLSTPALTGVTPAAAAPASVPPGGLTANPAAAPAGTRLLDFVDGSAALSPDRIVDSACQFCNSNCRLKVGLKAGRIIEVRGEREDQVQAGNLCIKAEMMPELVYNELRLTTPLRRVSGRKGSKDSRFEPISWDQALTVIGRKLLQLRDDGEVRSIANRTTGRLPRGTGSLVARLFALLGSPNNTDVGPVCNDAGGNALATTFGMGNFTNGYGLDPATGKQDLGAARYLLFLGTNQAETHPVTFDYLLRERAKTGAKLVVVDPRRTPTAVRADVWVAPKPHTDLALALSLLHHIISNKLYDAQFVQRWVLGFDELREHVLQGGYDVRWAAGVTGIPAETITAIAEDYATAKPAAIFCNAGISHQLGAFDTYRCLTFLAAITGNIGQPGGGCNFMHNTWPGDLHLPTLTHEVPERDVALPVGPDHFADAILTGTPYRLRAVITEGNPLVSSANNIKVRKAYEKLEFYVYTGLFMEEAAWYADIILPIATGLEIDGVYMRRDDRAIRWQDQVVSRPGAAKPDWHLWIDLAHTISKLDRRNKPSYWTSAFPLAWKNYENLWAEFVRHTPAMGGMTAERMRSRAEPLRWPCPTPQHPGVSTLYLDHPSWYEATAALGHEGKRFLTPSGKVEITTPELDASLRTAGHTALPRFYTHPEVTGRHPTIRYSDTFVINPLNPQALTRKVELGVQPTGDDVHRRYPLMGMSGRPSVVHFATVTHWTRTGKQLNGVRLIQLHPKAAERAGIRDGDDVRVESPRGSVTGTALIWEGIREDTVFVPNTFGPAQQVGDLFDDPRYEAANVLPDDRYFDNLSGQQAFKCFACRVVKA